MFEVKTEWCNWTFEECIKQNQKWLVSRDCSEPITLSNSGGRNWKAYKLSLQPRYQDHPPLGMCPNCGKAVNGVNPSDDGETWRM